MWKGDGITTEERKNGRRKEIWMNQRSMEDQKQAKRIQVFIYEDGMKVVRRKDERKKSSKKEY